MHFLMLAIKAAMPTSENDLRNYYLGCVGLRKDRTIIFSQNGAFVYSSPIEMQKYKKLSSAHAECRALRKMDKGGELFVARIRKLDKSIAMAMPCQMCQVKIKAAGIKRVFFTINQHQYGVWSVSSDEYVIHNLKIKKSDHQMIFKF